MSIRAGSWRENVEADHPALVAPAAAAGRASRDMGPMRAFPLVWRWRTVKPWPQIARMPHPLAYRFGWPMREICRGRNGNALFEFDDGYRTVAPWRAGRRL